jgi:vitamin B12 transporter
MYRKGRWNFTFNYTYLNGEVTTVKYVYDPNSFSYVPDGDTTYNYQFRRPRHSINLFAGYQFTNKLFVSAHARFVGKRYEPRFMDTPLELESYKVFDLYGEYRFSKNLRIFLDIKNLFDEDYVDIKGFTTRPINFIGGMSFQIN